MFYQSSLEIERRLETALMLIQSCEYSTPMLAGKARHFYSDGFHIV